MYSHTECVLLFGTVDGNIGKFASKGLYRIKRRYCMRKRMDWNYRYNLIGYNKDIFELRFKDTLALRTCNLNVRIFVPKKSLLDVVVLGCPIFDKNNKLVAIVSFDSADEIKIEEKTKEELRQLRDPIHGFIDVTESEKKIIDSMPFQRLH